MIDKSILYIGNNLASKTKYITTMETLSGLFIDEGVTLFKSSSKKNKVLRLLDMVISVFKYRNKVSYILIDTYSTINFYYAFIISQLSRILKINYIPILHGGDLPSRIDRSRKMADLIFNYSYKNIAPSGYLKYEFEKRGYKTNFIPNVLQIKDYKFKQRKSLKPKLLFVRAFADIYNPKMAINVLYSLRKKYPEAKLCMIGPDRDGILKEIIKYIEEKDLLNSIEITGVLSKADWHKKSEEFDVFINTTNIDNTPVSVIEAMALGIPVVSTNVGGITYLIEDNKDCLLVDKNDAINMRKKIELLLRKEEVVEELTKNARNKVEQFDWIYVKKEWNKILV